MLFFVLFCSFRLMLFYFFQQTIELLLNVIINKAMIKTSISFFRPNPFHMLHCTLNFIITMDEINIV